MRDGVAQEKAGLLAASTFFSLALCRKDVTAVKEPNGLELPWNGILTGMTQELSRSQLYTQKAFLASGNSCHTCRVEPEASA